MLKIKAPIDLALLFGMAVSVAGQTAPTVHQTATRSSCSNIVALSGAKIDCANLTPAQKKALADIPTILKMALSNQDYLDAILAKLNEISKAPHDVQQGNSGGINVQQVTAGGNSPIINSPITVGSLPKTISPADMVALKAYFLGAKNKAKIQITADQYSGAVPFPDDFYDALKAGGWEMVDAGVSRMEVFSAPGRKFQGAVVTVNGEPIPEGQGITVDSTDPLAYVGTALQVFKIPHSLSRNKNQPEGTINITFYGGFPE